MNKLMIYTHLKNLIINLISALNFEFALLNINLKHTVFMHYLNDDMSDSDIFNVQIHFLYNHYFFQLS